MGDLLGHLATRLATHPETIATEALTFVLRQSAAARSALDNVLLGLGASSSGALGFVGRAPTSEGIPDIVGRDASGVERLLIEAKFWAGLTNHQPVTYLRRLSPDGTLLFVVPSVRIELIWSELLRRTAKEAISTTPIATIIPNSYAARCATSFMAIVTWGGFLGAIENVIQHANDLVSLANVRQLRGLCEQMDNAGFLPLTSEELTSGLWRRFKQLGEMVPAIATQLKKLGIASTDGRLSSSTSWTSQQMRMRGMAVDIFFDSEACARRFPTPFWLGLPGAARIHLAPLELEAPCRLFEWGTEVHVALRVPLGAERAEVIAEVVREIERVAALLPVPASPLAKVGVNGPPLRGQ